MGFLRGIGRKRRGNGNVTLLTPQNRNYQYPDPDNTPLYVRRGWSGTGNIHKGYYRTRFGAWQGRIERHGDIFDPYIKNPPVSQLKKHPRWVCCQKQKGNEWLIHLHKQPSDKDIGSIILYVESLIIESHRL